MSEALQREWRFYLDDMPSFARCIFADDSGFEARDQTKIC